MPGGHTPGAATTTAFCLCNRCGPMVIAVIRHANSATKVAVGRAYPLISRPPNPVHSSDQPLDHHLSPARRIRLDDRGDTASMPRNSWWVAVALVASLFAPPEASWVWPVGGNQVIIRDFIAPETPWGPGHRGIDIDASHSPTLRAPVSGRLRFVGGVVNRGVVTIETREGFLVSMEPVTIDLPSGTMVRAGQKIGTVDSGHCPRRCLHLGLRIDSQYVSPAAFLGVERRAVLFPWVQALG